LKREEDPLNEFQIGYGFPLALKSLPIEMDKKPKPFGDYQ
jgi:hypothetical protein